jgi:hypothetical protein
MSKEKAPESALLSATSVALFPEDNTGTFNP